MIFLISCYHEVVTTSHEMMRKTNKMTNKFKKIANAAALSAAVMPYAVGALALADDDEIIKEQSDLEAAIEQAPAVERAGGPINILTRGYSDGHGNLQSHVIVSNGFGKLAFRDEGDSRITGADLALGEIYNDLAGFRFNAGTEEIKSSGDTNSRALIEKSYKDSKWLDFWNLEVQDLAKPLDDRIAGAIGLKFSDVLKDKDNVRPQFTLDSEGNFGYALIWNTSENSGIAVGGHRINDLDTFNISAHNKWGSGALEGYKVWAHAKIFENGEGLNNGLEARIRFGDKTPGGAFVNGVQDTLFNSITGFLAGDGDATFPFGIGSDPFKFDFFGAAASNSGEAGKFSFDIKYSNPGISDRTLKTDIAVGLGDISHNFLTHNKFQIGRTSYLDNQSSNSDVSNLEYHTTLLSGGKDKNGNESWAVHLGIRYTKPEDARGTISGALAVSYNF
ncbi:hypothetical protein J4447_01385 [Candidatus Pacearchaeota archaeon]|nr:hypothetical protein [Candidatus Pacearchaeota archaeon]